jgi:hypothetical protein
MIKLFNIFYIPELNTVYRVKGNHQPAITSLLYLGWVLSLLFGMIVDLLFLSVYNN